jgi:hypothetical protein
MKWLVTLLSLLALPSTAAGAVDRTQLPLGDQKKSAAPMRDWVYSCQNADQFGGGAGNAGPWIDQTGGTWDSTAKIAVQGSVSWNSVFWRKLDGSGLTLAGNGLPSSPTGTFPVASSDPAYQYDRNPNSIGSVSFSRTLPADPQIAASPTCVGGGVGISLLGVPIFSAFDATLRDANAWEVQDGCGGHPQNRGVYHFHSLPTCFADYASSKRHSKLAGYALDGFGIYGYRGRKGKEMSNAKLDACHGHTHAVRFNGTTQRIYHYHATREFPYLVGCFRGTPVTGVG